MTALSQLIKQEAQKAIKDRRISGISKETGIHKSWFYQMAESDEPNPNARNAYKFLKAVNHPVVRQIDKYSGRAA